VLDERYLVMGLDALGRAAAGDYFADGHRGAAIIAAYYLCREGPVEPGAAEAMAGMIDRRWAQTGLCAPSPPEAPDQELLQQVTGTLDANIGRLRQAGHNVIIPSLALRAFRQLPEAITPSRVNGVCRLIEAFDTAEDISPEDTDASPDPADASQFAEFALRQTLQAIQAFLGRGQGWSGHMLTYSRALIDLHRLGYEDLARHGLYAHGLYVKRLRMGPRTTDGHFREHEPTDLRPTDHAYWAKRRRQPIGIGHCFKYPYGFYGLLSLARAPDLKQAALAGSYRLF